MTIGIGLLCDGGKRILLAADTRASYGQISQHDETGKLFELPFNFCGVIAGTIAWCSELISELHHRMGKLVESEMGAEKIREAIQESYGRIFLLLAEEKLFNGFKINMDQYLHDEHLVQDIRRSAEDALKNLEVDVDLIVGGFIGNGPFLFVVSGGTSVAIRAEISPGNAVIGSGSIAALNWLNYRKQNVHC
jgi:20S proteasome alpha/beta subunit